MFHIIIIFLVSNSNFTKERIYEHVNISYIIIYVYIYLHIFVYILI